MQVMTVSQLLQAFPDDEAAEQLFVSRRWPDGVACPYCEGRNVQEGTAHPQMPFRCRDCGRFFSVRTGTVMQRSKIGYQGWLIAMHRVLTNATEKGGLKLDHELGITQKSAWLLAYRIRTAWAGKQGVA